LSGLTVTTEHYLVVGTRTPAGLLVFDLYAGGAPLPLRWPDSVPFTPSDLAASTDGGLWVLDRGRKRLWRLDRTLCVVPAAPAPVRPAVFVPAQGEPAAGVACAPGTISNQAAVVLPGAVDPIVIAVLPDGSVLVLDNDPAQNHSVVRRYRDGLPAGVRALDHDLVELFEGGGLTTLKLRGRDLVFVLGSSTPRRTTGTLYVAALDDMQAFAYELVATPDSLELRLIPRLYPLRQVAEHGFVHVEDRIRYGFGDRWVPLAEYPQGRYVPEGTLELPAATEAFDGREPRCVWHRLLVDGALPADSEVVVESRASDDLDLLAATPWQREPRLYRRGDGAELPFYRVADSTGAICEGSWEVLLQSAQGRYLQLRLTLGGHGRTTPRLQALRVYYPRFAYLRQYLPPVYREDTGSASFLDRFLANVEGIYTSIEGRVADVQVLFDNRIAPAVYLPWLASWLGVGLEAGWSERTSRLFLTHAAGLFTQRGTVAGLVRAVRLALEPCVDECLFEEAGCGTQGFGVRVVERFRLRQAPGVVFGDPTDLLGPGSTSDALAWNPANGAEPLHQRFRVFLATRYATIGDLNAAWSASFSGFDDPTLRLSALRPAGNVPSRDWQAFVAGAIGFTYATAADGDEPLFREYLARRYHQATDVNRAWNLGGAAALASFADVKTKLWDGVLHATLPAGGAALSDWIAFVSQVLPTARNAHRFTVLVPIGLSDTRADQIRKRDLADRIASLEKPAHTQYEVRLYWGLFRVGEARVGLETQVGASSRSAALVLGRDQLGASHLGFGDAFRRPDRLVLPTDMPGCPAPSAACVRN
jgi:phage tail-like protein